MALTRKQQAFVNEYLKSFNATWSAKTAGYSEKTAYSQGARLLKNVEISSEIDRIYRENTMSGAEVLYHLTQIARGDIDDLTDEFGNLDKAKARELGKTNLIKKVKQRTVTTEDSEIHEAEIEAYDRLKALDLLAKHHDLTNRVKVEDWESELITDIRAGRINYEDVRGLFDRSLADDLFVRAGKVVVSENGNQ